MTKKEKSILISLCIGDGHLSKCNKGSKGVSLVMLHSKKQQQLLVHKVNLLHSIIGGKKPNIYDINNNGYPGIRAQKNHRYFRVIRKWLYKNNKKQISRKILNKLSPQAIAIWWMDDGCLSAKRQRGKIHAYECVLNCHDTYENVNIIKEYFNEVWDIQFSIVRDKKNYRLRCGTKMANKFFKIFKDFVIPEMKYKVSIISGKYKNV